MCGNLLCNNRKLINLFNDLPNITITKAVWDKINKINGIINNQNLFDIDDFIFNVMNN